jgi:hypothetical protein
VWDAYWVPKYDSFGRITHGRTGIVYTVDLVRGMDVYRVRLPGEDPAFTAPVQLGFGLGLPVGIVVMALLGAVAVRRRVAAG